MGGRGWERDIIALEEGDWIITYPDGRQETMPEVLFHASYEPAAAEPAAE
ncbi:MAG TPA: hypothetical protein VGC80_17630 [Acetobacteraceae bacterium]